MTQTPYLDLTKPAGSENVSVTLLNENFDKIDAGVRNSANALPWVLIQEYLTPGTYTFTAPDLFNGSDYDIGVYEIGGGGSGAATYCTVLASVVSGGAAGYGKNIIIRVTPGNQYPVVIGAGGVAVIAQYDQTLAGNAGGSTSFNGVTVNGGGGGKKSVSTTFSFAEGADGGQGSDAITTLFNTSNTGPYGCTATFAQHYNDNSQIYNGGRSQSAKEGQNAFDLTMISLAAGGWARQNYAQTGATLPDGTKGGNGVFAASGTVTAESATGNGNGGGAAKGNDTATSGAGAPGAVYIYARKAAS